MDTASAFTAADAASEAPALEEEMLEPEMAMASDEAASSEETDTAVQADTTTETTGESAELPVEAVDSTSVAQEIVQTRQARVIVLSAMEPEFAENTQEYLENGFVLVTLKDAAACEQLANCISRCAGVRTGLRPGGTVFCPGFGALKKNSRFCEAGIFLWSGKLPITHFTQSRHQSLTSSTKRYSATIQPTEIMANRGRNIIKTPKSTPEC